MKFCYNINVTAEMDNIKSVEFGDTIKVTFNNGIQTEFDYFPVGERPSPEPKASVTEEAV